ncbi:hypothetical protein A3F66_06665 [candidate division TM6 bacterium RIFCSPHIGHO2_12_FULL_32_22]|nr:MAG: hypothetical protein A3F66_06665 [candidate division TM6 bacterium RIFCSPHIGHO2_12_FULL_32_22]
MLKKLIFIILSMFLCVNSITPRALYIGGALGALICYYNYKNWTEFSEILDIDEKMRESKTVPDVSLAGFVRYSEWLQESYNRSPTCDQRGAYVPVTANAMLFFEIHNETLKELYPRQYSFLRSLYYRYESHADGGEWY